MGVLLQCPGWKTIAKRLMLFASLSSVPSMECVAACNSEVADRSSSFSGQSASPLVRVLNPRVWNPAPLFFVVRDAASSPASLFSPARCVAVMSNRSAAGDAP
jgi:hypothetical protein